MTPEHFRFQEASESTGEPIRFIIHPTGQFQKNNNGPTCPLVGFFNLPLIYFNSSHCVKYSSPPLSEAQRLLMAKPLILVYTDSFYIDSSSMAQNKYRI